MPGRSAGHFDHRIPPGFLKADFWDKVYLRPVSAVPLIQFQPPGIPGGFFVPERRSSYRRLPPGTTTSPPRGERLGDQGALGAASLGNARHATGYNGETRAAATPLSPEMHDIASRHPCPEIEIHPTPWCESRRRDCGTTSRSTRHRVGPSVERHGRVRPSPDFSPPADQRTAGRVRRRHWVHCAMPARSASILPR